jgi:hypothetical protein
MRRIIELQWVPCVLSAGPLLGGSNDGGLASFGNSSRPTLLQRLRANSDHLQQQLDHWDASVLRRLFVNSESAVEHAQRH